MACHFWKLPCPFGLPDMCQEPTTFACQALKARREEASELSCLGVTSGDTPTSDIVVAYAYINMCIFMCVHMFVYIYVYISCVYICTYMCTYIYIAHIFVCTCTAVNE